MSGRSNLTKPGVGRTRVGDQMTRKIQIAVVFAVLIGVASAAPKDVSDGWKKTVRVGDCKLDSSPMVDVRQEVEGDMDRSSNGPWADLNYTRHIRVWELSEEKYCAVVEYDGAFNAVEGMKSPGSGEVLTGKEHGEMQGGYRAIISGSEINQSVEWPYKGEMQPVNYQCRVASGDCENKNDWTQSFFNSNQDVEYEWWAWVYDSGKCGTWTNTKSENSGDVLCQ